MKAKGLLIVSIIAILFKITMASTGYFAAKAQTTVPSGIMSVAWSPDGTKIAGAGLQGLLRIWDASTGQILQDFQGINVTVLSVAWSPDGTKVVSGSADNLLRVWSANSGQLLATLVGHEDVVTSVQWSPDGTKIASVSFNEQFTLRTWDTATYQPLRQLSAGNYYSIAWSPDGQYIAVAGFGSGADVYDADLDFPLSETFNFGVGPIDSMSSVAWNTTSSRVAVGSLKGEIYVWDTITDQQVMVLTGHQDIVSSLAWSPNSQQIASISIDGTIRFWNSNTGQLLHEVTYDGQIALLAIDWSPDSTKLAYGTENDTFALIDAPSISVCIPTQTVAAGDVTGFINAINAANANTDASVIGVDGTYTFTAINNGLNALPKITTDITICSQNGATLARQAGSPAFRFFEVASNGTLTLENLTLTGADSGSEPGGAILNTGNLTVNNVTFSGNHAGTGAAIDNHRFGGTSNPITATISNSTFQNNTANYGAALDNDANATMTVTSSTFTGNVAVHDGGAIRNHGTLSLTDSQILNNTASAGGSGIFSTGSTTAHNSCISGNTASVTSVVHVGSNVQDFAGNYWGAADGPSGAGGGSGDSVNHNINFADFLTACPHD